MIKGVILINVGRNLNRAVRTAYSFGVHNIYCLCCTGQVSGPLFSAAGKVRLHNVSSLELFDPMSVLGLEVTICLPDIKNIDRQRIKYLAVGGESTTLKRRDFPCMARIPTVNSLCLTTEAALAIAFYEMGCGDRE